MGSAALTRQSPTRKQTAPTRRGKSRRVPEGSQFPLPGGERSPEPAQRGQPKVAVTVHLGKKSSVDSATEKRLIQLELEATQLRSRILELEQHSTWLESEREHFAGLFNGVPVGYALLDELGTIQQTN